MSAGYQIVQGAGGLGNSRKESHVGPRHPAFLARGETSASRKGGETVGETIRYPSAKQSGKGNPARGRVEETDGALPSRGVRGGLQERGRGNRVGT